MHNLKLRQRVKDVQSKVFKRRNTSSDIGAQTTDSRNSSTAENRQQSNSDTRLSSLKRKSSLVSLAASTISRRRAATAAAASSKAKKGGESKVVVEEKKLEDYESGRGAKGEEVDVGLKNTVEELVCGDSLQADSLARKNSLEPEVEEPEEAAAVAAKAAETAEDLSTQAASDSLLSSAKMAEAARRRRECTGYPGASIRWGGCRRIPGRRQSTLFYPVRRWPYPHGIRATGTCNSHIPLRYYRQRCQRRPSNLPPAPSILSSASSPQKSAVRLCSFLCWRKILSFTHYIQRTHSLAPAEELHFAVELHRHRGLL